MTTKRDDQHLAAIDAKVAELKAAIHDANAALKDLRAERKELRAYLDWTLDEHQHLLAGIIERSSGEILRATGEIMAAVGKQLDDVVQRSQSVQTLVRVDRLLHFVASQVTSDDGDAAS